MPNKRNAHGSGTIRKRKDGLWEARVTTGHNPLTGKSVRKSIYGKTQKEVREKLTQLTLEVDTGTFTEPSKLTVGQWIDIWVSEYLGDVKPNTVTKYKSRCNLHIKPALGMVKLVELSAHTVQTFINRLQKSSDQKESMKPKTIKDLHGVLHRALQQAVEIGYIKFNPSDACKLPRVDRKEVQPLDEDEITAFLAAIHGHKHETIYLVTLFTGIRQGEALGLSWAAVDFKQGTITIDRQLQRNRDAKTWEIVTPKNNKARRITPAQSVMTALWEWRQIQMQWRVKAGVAWSESGLVFTDELGKHLTSEMIRKPFKKIVADIGIPESRFHDLRHSYAVAALSSGDDIKTVQKNLGHHTAAFTLDTYGHVTEKMEKESAARMENFIKKRKAT